MYDAKIAAQKQRNVEIFNETLRVIKQGFYITPSGKKINLQCQNEMIAGTECIHYEQSSNNPKLDTPTIIKIENNDTFKAAEELMLEGYVVAVLNFASGGHPGGGVRSGARAQEESLCRRSNLVRSLYTLDPYYASQYKFAQNPGSCYPLSDLNHSVVYSPKVQVFRDGIDCSFMETPFLTSVISCAALNLNGRYDIHLTPDGHMPDTAKTITRNKIRAIFRTALNHSHDALVLGAFGCGAFKNPPADIARLFHEVILEEEFVDRFRKIVFAIIEDHNSNNANLKAFESEFSNLETHKN